MVEESDVTAHNSKTVWRDALEDPEVRAWHEKLEMRSTLTADEYVRVLGRYCMAIGTTPAAIVAGAKDQNGGRRTVEKRLQDFVMGMRKPHRPSTHGSVCQLAPRILALVPTTPLPPKRVRS